MGSPHLCPCPFHASAAPPGPPPLPQPHGGCNPHFPPLALLRGAGGSRGALGPVPVRGARCGVPGAGAGCPVPGAGAGAVAVPRDARPASRPAPACREFIFTRGWSLVYLVEPFPGKGGRLRRERGFVLACHPLGPQAGHRGLAGDRAPSPAPPAPPEPPQPHCGAAAALWVWGHRLQLCPRVTLHTSNLSFSTCNCTRGGQAEVLAPTQFGGPAPLTPLSSAPTDSTGGKGGTGPPVLLWGARRGFPGLGFGVVWGCFPAGSSPGSAPGSWLGQQLLLPESSSLPGNGKNRVNKAGLAPGGGTPRQVGAPQGGGAPHGVLALQNGADQGWGAETPEGAESGGAECRGAGFGDTGIPQEGAGCRIWGSRNAQICRYAGFRAECTPGNCRDPKRDAGSRDPTRIQGCRTTGKVHWDRVWDSQDPRRVQRPRNWGDTVTWGCKRGAGPLGEGGPQCVHHVGGSGEQLQVE